MSLDLVALLCVSCDLPATRKVCGFTSFSSSHGCSKCMKVFSCERFGTKLDYSGYERNTWEMRTHELHQHQVSMLKNAHTASDFQLHERRYGVRYSELLRLQYFDIVEFHVIDPMHNLLLGTAKYLLTMWKDEQILTRSQFDHIQQEVDAIRVPPGIGRVPHKISSNFSGFTADQWKNWVCLYSSLCLKELLPSEHYQCWVLFQDACYHLLQPSISTMQLSIADQLLYEFCKAYETLYGKEKCTPNMHMHMHLSKCIENYGPVTAFWCFPFERFNGILGTFQKNWITPEQQMVKKFLSYQQILLMDLPSALPLELREFFEDHVCKCMSLNAGEGSVMQTHVDSSSLLQYKKNSLCALASIDATESAMHALYRRYEGIFDSDEIHCLTCVYQTLYPGRQLKHIPMMHEKFQELQIFNEVVSSSRARGSHSSAICANWAGIGGSLTTNNTVLRVGIVQHFIRHAVQLDADSKIYHIFARVFWFKNHPRENWFNSRTYVLSPDLIKHGPATFIPVSRIRCRCAIIKKKIQFDYGEDVVPIAILCGSNYSV